MLILSVVSDDSTASQQWAIDDAGLHHRDGLAPRGRRHARFLDDAETLCGERVSAMYSFSEERFDAADPASCPRCASLSVPPHAG